MKKLLWRDYQRDGFNPREAIALADVSARFDKLYLSPSHMNSKIAEQCNAITQKALHFLETVKAEDYPEMWEGLFECIGHDVTCMNQMSVNALSASTGIEFHLIQGHDTDRALWAKLNPITESSESLSEQEACEILEYRLIGSPPSQEEMSPVQLEEDVLWQLQDHLDHTSLGLLVIPGNTWDPNKTFTEILSKVHQSNIQLDETTGWGEDALGLKGRVQLMLGCAYTGDTGLCSKKNVSGNSAQNDPVVIKTSPFNHDWVLSGDKKRKSTDYLFSSLGHEWLHALDYIAQEGRDASMLNISSSLSVFNKKIDTLAVEEKEKEQVFEFYKSQVLFCIYQCLASQWSETLEKESALFIEEVLSEENIDEEKIKNFLEKNSFDEESWVQISIRLAVAHKIKNGSIREMPFLMRNRALDENVMENGGNAYLTLPMERLAYSFEKSMNRFNPLNSEAGIYSPSDIEAKILRGEWKLFFAENKKHFLEMPTSNLWVEEKTPRFQRKALRQDLVWQLQSIYRKAKGFYLDLDQEMTHVLETKMCPKDEDSSPAKIKKNPHGFKGWVGRGVG